MADWLSAVERPVSIREGHRFDSGILHSFKAAERWLFLMAYYVYILYSEKTNKFYVGSTEDITERLDNRHNAGRNISTKSGIPWVLRYCETFNSRTDAIKRELEIKRKKSRAYIEWLIGSVQ